MADLFDIANLITTVGVDAVKIKPEPGLPEKSSNEILTELFSTFDADEGIVSPQNSDAHPIDESDIKTEKPEKKKKKSKKKHKHKTKKHKKKYKRSTSDSGSNVDENGTKKKKKKKKHKKKSKRKHGLHSSKSNSEDDEPKSKVRKLEEGASPGSDVKSKDAVDYVDISEKKASVDGTEKSVKNNAEAAPKSANDTEEEKRGTESPLLPSVAKKDDDDPEEPIIAKPLEKKRKQSAQGKILIKDLKNSAVYNETVKEVESKEREKAARMEDGELTESSDDDDDDDDDDNDDDDDDDEDNDTPTLSPSPPRRDIEDSPIATPLPERSKKRSTSTVARAPRDDLRNILKEKEKKRLEELRKGKGGKERKESKKDRNRKDSKDKVADHGRSRERRRSESHSRANSHRSRSKGKEKRREKSRERRERDKSDDRWENERSRENRKHGRDDRDKHRSRSEERNREWHSRGGRSRSRERKEWIEIDKKKLLEIARRNAINMIKQGALPLAQQDKAIAAIQAGGKSVDELTDFCKSLSKSEALGELSSISSDEDGSGSEKGFHHPFLVKERPNSIIMNIRDAKQLPTKTFQEKTAESSNQLRLQFPVSSGQLHRKTENEWVPVAPKKPEPKKAFLPASMPSQSFTTTPTPVVLPIAAPPVAQPTIFPQGHFAENVDIGTIVSQRLAAMRKLRENPNDSQALTEMYRAQTEMKSWAESKQMPGQFTGSTGAKVLSAAELSSGYQAWARKFSGTVSVGTAEDNNSTFPVRRRLCRRHRPLLSWRWTLCLRGHRNAVAFGTWLHQGRNHFGCLMMPNLWPSSDQLLTAQPVSGGMGMALLQKMGWRPGEGLGKNKEGTLEPLQLEVKLDKRGLVSEQDFGRRPGPAGGAGGGGANGGVKAAKPVVPTIKTLEGKHPVSLLGEYCSKRKYGAPVYELCFECGPDHRKNFLFKVKVNGIEYKPSVASPNKKQAKAEAAQICLQTLGLLPS